MRIDDFIRTARAATGGGDRETRAEINDILGTIRQRITRSEFHNLLSVVSGSLSLMAEQAAFGAARHGYRPARSERQVRPPPGDAGDAGDAETGWLFVKFLRRNGAAALAEKVETVLAPSPARRKEEA